MATIYDWSLTPINNATADSDINWQEGQLPSTVNNSARQMMTRVAQLVDDLGGIAVATGSANAIAVTTASPFATYVDGMIITFRAIATNTTLTTISCNGVGAKNAYKWYVNDTAPLRGGEIATGCLVTARYVAALAAGAGGWLIDDVDGRLGWEQVGPPRNLASLSAIDWTNLGVYRELRLSVSMVVAASSGVTLFTSADNGASFHTGATDYTYGAFSNVNGTIAGGGTVAAANYPLASGAVSPGLARFNVYMSEFNKVVSQPVTGDSFYFRTSGSVYVREFSNGSFQGGPGLVKNALRLAITAGASAGFAIMEGVRG